jgi:hypothetical protein
MIPHPYTGKNLGEGVAVPSDFRLPWNTTVSLRDNWGAWAGVSSPAPKKKKLRHEKPAKRRHTYAGHDPSEVQFLWTRR